jgi:hypothetical protein
MVKINTDGISRFNINENSLRQVKKSSVKIVLDEMRKFKISENSLRWDMKRIETSKDSIR